MERISIGRQILTPEEEEQVRQKLRARLQSDKYVSSLLSGDGKDLDKCIHSSSAAFLRYLDDNAVCAGCKGLRCCRKGSRRGFVTRLRLNPYLDAYEDYSIPCRYYAAVREVLGRFLYSDVGLESTYESSYRTIDALKAVGGQTVVERSFADTGTRAFSLASKTEKGGYIVSDNNNGLHLLLALAFYYARSRKLTCAVVDAAATLADCVSLNEAVRNDATQDLASASSAQALFISGFGIGYKSAAMRDRVLIPLLNRRSEKGYVTWFSSMLARDEVIEAYAGRDSSSLAVLAKLMGGLGPELRIADVDYFA